MGARCTPRDFAALTREGYQKNAIVHRAVKLVAENAASVSWLLYDGEAEHDARSLLDLIARPNPRQDGAAFLGTMDSLSPFQVPVRFGNPLCAAAGSDASAANRAPSQAFA